MGKHLRPPADPPTARARRGERARARRAQQRQTPLHHRLLALPWLTIVLAVLVLAGAASLARTDHFVATSTITATNTQAATAAAAALEADELTARVERDIELEERLHGTVTLTGDRPGQLPVVVVRAQAPDPRLAALAADTAAALIVAEGQGITLAEPAVVPTAPVSQGPWSIWALVGAVALTGAVLVERRQLAHARGPAHQSTVHKASHRATPLAAGERG